MCTARQIYPNEENCSLEELEQTIKSSRLNRTAQRLLAMKSMMLGVDFSTTCKLFSISDTTLYNWIHRFNAKGIDGLLPREKTGRPRRIAREELSTRINIVEEPQRAGQTHWTGKKLHGYLRDDLKIELGYSTVLRYLKEARYSLQVPRPWSHKQDEQAREAFISKLKELTSNSNVRLWYLDEVGFDGDPRPRRKWAKVGSSPKIPKSGKHLRMSVTGMACPESGEFVALEFPFSDKETFQAFLNFANKEIEFDETREDLIILDNASWHKSKKIIWGKFKPLFLPAYSPDLNPIERLWQYIKSTYFASFFAKNIDELIEQIDYALIDLFKQPDKISSICRAP